MNGRERMIAACRGEAVDRPPVWLMRQAGRHLPEYNELRGAHTFWEMVRTPELAAEVTLQPVRRYGMDAAVVFSDILIVPEAMGIEVRFGGGGPVITDPVVSREALERLQPVDAAEAFGFLDKTLRILCDELHPQGTAVIGFAGAPFTLAAYLVEGKSSRDVRNLKALAYNDPELARDILGRLSEVVVDLLLLQVRAGADVVQLFDTWSGYLSPEDYETLSLPWNRMIVERLREEGVPVILYLRNAAGHLEAAAATGCQVLSVDSSLRLADARRRLPATVGLQGNLDPAELLGPPERIRQRIGSLIRDAEGGGYVVNLGQGVTPDVPIAGVEALVSAVRAGGGTGCPA